MAQAYAFVEAVRLAIGTPLQLLDLGSGGGIPGLVAAAALPDTHCTLLDGREERARLLRGHVTRLGWSARVDIVAARAEVAGHGDLRGRFDAVLARGFGAPAATAECGAAFLRPGGVLVVSDPPEGAGQRWPVEGLERLGLAPRPLLQQAWALSCFELVTPLDDRYPRRVGIPAKRPLF
ncbi:MAG: class I SAM-dependent methyltransferase [Actinomycetota bacterium]|nr:class I SAM-dependent methyltransferase [Actinomycetota bacterium]